MASGHVERHGKNWSVIIDYGRQYDPEAKKMRQVRKRIGSKPTQKQAMAWLHEVLAEIGKGTFVPPTTLTVEDYLRQWYNEKCVPRLAPKTLENYRMVVEKHLVPRIGKMRLDKLQPYGVETMLTTMLSDGAHPRTVEQVYQIFHIALNQAVKWQILARNVADFVEPPRPDKHEIVPLSLEELDRLLEAAGNSPMYPVIFLALHTGMRRGELLGLKWECVDLDEGFIRVESNLQRIDGKIVVGSPKSAKSRREIPLDDETISFLRSMGKHHEHHDLVFTREGKPIEPSSVTQQFATIAKRAGFKMRFHDLRHSYVTTALAAGVDLRTIQDLVGHEDFSTTANTYAHILRSVKRDAAKAIGGALMSGKHQKNTKTDLDEVSGRNDQWV